MQIRLQTLRVRLIFAVVLLSTIPATGTEILKVEVDVPGGSATVERVDQENRQVRLSPSAHKDRGWACWWYLKLTGIQTGDLITLDVGPAPWATPDRAAYSLDGITWRQTEPGQRMGRRINYSQKVDATHAWFAWGPPFVPSDAQTLVDQAAKDSLHAQALTLCQTRKGRPVPAIRIADRSDEIKDRVAIWIQARQHAWESGSSWVAKGFVQWLLSGDSRASELRKNSITTVVPIMDIDNVYLGAGGKNQIPQDHNRDWTAEPHWRSVAAAQQQIRQFDQDGRLVLFVDLHNPGANDRQPYFYVPPDELLPDSRRGLMRSFLAAAEAEIVGPLAFKGRTIVSGRKYDARRWKAISKNWVAANCRSPVVSVTLETPWNTPHSTQAGYQQVGRELGRAIERFLRD